jgi:hypothetical protein
LYATLGTKLMMDLSKTSIGEGDIVILAPELNEQTYSLYFNAEAVLEAMDGFSSRSLCLPASDQLELFYNYYKFAEGKLKYWSSDSAPDPIGIYRRDSLNAYGDMSAERENNIMNNGVDSNMYVYTDDSLLDSEFIDYVNEYNQYIEKKGARLYFSFCPVNLDSIRSSKAKRAEFQSRLSESLDCELLYDIESCLIRKEYFYDTNFHLNSDGAIYYTDLLTTALKEKLDIHTANGIDVPDAPPLAEEEVQEPTISGVAFDRYTGEPNNDYVDCFNYILVGNSYQIASVKDEYKDMEEVILPSTYQGKNITVLMENALYGCTDLKRVHIGKTYKSLEAGAFNGCIALEGIYLYQEDGNQISPPSDGLLDGCNKKAKLYILEGADYASGYTWFNYADKFEYFTREDQA